VDQPSRMRPNALTYGTVHWRDRFAKASAELAQGVRLPHSWKSLQPGVASNLVKEAVWDRFEASSLECINTRSISSHAENPLPQYGTGTHAGAIAGLHIIIQFHKRVFPTTRRLPRIYAMP
jgi:hypothetical protein